MNSQQLTFKQLILFPFCGTLAYQLPRYLSLSVQVMALRYMNGNAAYGAMWFARGVSAA